jgi:hypothetical protein
MMMKSEEGSTIILAGFALLGLLLMTGLVIDGGTLYMTKSHMQKAANAAVLSGAQELTNQETEVTRVVNEVLTAHKEEMSVTSLLVEMNSKVNLNLEKNVSLVFSGLFGYDVVPVAVHAAAAIETMGRAAGAAPLGIDDSIQLEYYKEYQLKVAQQDVDTGNFGVLALGGTGAQTYEDNLRYGYQSEIKAGDVIDTQTGNISGKTRSVIKEKIDSCPYLNGETHHRDCPRVVLVPVYKPEQYDTNQLKSVRITGFAYFYITQPMDSKDTSISGMFIKRAGTGYTDPTIINKGAYSIKLTE